MKEFVKIIIILSLNILLSGLLTLACVLTSFQLGWADTGDHTVDTLLVFCGYIILHLILNLLLITRPKKHTPFLVFAICVFILILYGFIWVYLKADVFGYYEGGHHPTFRSM